MKLYERRDELGRIVEWWTQRNERGNYFSIMPHLHKGKYSVVINAEDANCTVFAVVNDFQTAENYLRKAEKLYR